MRINPRHREKARMSEVVEHRHPTWVAARRIRFAVHCFRAVVSNRMLSIIGAVDLIHGTPPAASARSPLPPVNAEAEQHALNQTGQRHAEDEQDGAGGPGRRRSATG